MYGLFGNTYRVATLPKSCLIVNGIIMECLKSIGQFWHVYIKEKNLNLYVYNYIYCRRKAKKESINLGARAGTFYYVFLTIYHETSSLGYKFSLIIQQLQNILFLIFFLLTFMHLIMVFQLWHSISVYVRLSYSFRASQEYFHACSLIYWWFCFLTNKYISSLRK